MTDYIPPPSSLPPGSSVWAYLRDSGGTAQELSVKQQESVIMAYCARHSLILTRLFADEAKTASTDKGRDMFAEMIDVTARPQDRPAGLLIWSLSRFARNQNDSPYYRAMLRKRGVVIHSLTEVLPDDSTAIVIEAVYDFTNAEKLRQTSRDVKRALHALARQGFIGGVPPRGYKAESVIIGEKRDGAPRKVSRWVIDPDLAPFVQKAWALAAEGKGTREIERATEGRLYKPKNSWTTFFANKTYIGILKFGDEEIEGVIPALIDRETWEAVQRHRQARARTNIRRGPTRGILSGLAFCARCNSTMSHSMNKLWRYYICGKKTREGAKACPERRIGADKADARVLDAVIGRVFTRSMAEALIAEVQAQLSDTSALDREIAQLDKQIAEVKRKIAHLNDQIENFGPAKSTQETLLRRETELAEVEGRRAHAEARKAAHAITITPDVLAFVINLWIGDLAQAREAKDVTAMQDLLRRFVSRVDLSYNSTRITYRFPLNDSDCSKDTVPLWGHSEILGKSILLFEAQARCVCVLFLRLLSRAGRRGLALFQRPTRYRCINLRHQPDGLFERHYHFGIVRLVFGAQFAPAPVFEPLVADLIAADVKFPHVFRHADKALLIVNPHRLVLVLGITRSDDVVTLASEFGDGMIEGFGFQQMQAYQFFTLGRQRAEQLKVAGERQAGKIYFEKLDVA